MKFSLKLRKRHLLGIATLVLLIGSLFLVGGMSKYPHEKKNITQTKEGSHHTADELIVSVEGVERILHDVIEELYSRTPGSTSAPSSGFTHLQVFKVAGQEVTWKVPEGVTHVRVQAWGGGGGGQSGTGNSKGGQAGGYVEDILTVIPGTNIEVTVGVGGNGGIQGLCGSMGGDSKFGNELIAYGGSSCDCATLEGGAGGEITIRGECGIDEGGTSPYGGSGGKLLSPFSTSSQGGAGTAPGGAGAPGRWTGGGSPAPQRGGDGAVGRIIVWW